MRIVCAWCRKEMGQKEPFEDVSVTHGMCPECFLKQTGKTPEEAAGHRKREPLYPHVPKSRSKPKSYLGGWKPGDIVIYSDFGLRSLYIVEVTEWGSKPDRFVDDFGVTHDRGMGSVRAKVIDTSLVDWDMSMQRISPWNKVGTIHYYAHTNLYKNIQDLINEEGIVLHSEVLHNTVQALKKPERWKVLEKYGLTWFN